MHILIDINFQAEPPTIVVATIRSLSQMLEKQIFKLGSVCVLVIDEVIKPLSGNPPLNCYAAFICWITHFLLTCAFRC